MSRVYKSILMILISLSLLTTMPIKVKAKSLENIITQETQQEQEQETQSQESITNKEYVEQLKDATTINETSEVATQINGLVKKVASFIINVLSYFITAFLAVKILLDLCYICLPFTRNLLANGYQGNAQASNNLNGMNNLQNGLGLNNMQMTGQGQMNTQPMNQVSGRIQWISNTALNAVESENVMNNNGKPNNASKVYGRSMVGMLVITTLLITLAITGALTDIGFLLGELIANGLSGISGML